MPMSLLFKFMKLWVLFLIYQEIFMKWIEEESFGQLIDDTQIAPIAIVTSSILVLFEILSLS